MLKFVTGGNYSYLMRHGLGATNSQSTEPTAATMECGNHLEEFISTGRTGRRNAMPDILDSNHAGTGTGSLTCTMEKLNCSDTSASASGSQSPSDTSTSKGS